VTRVDWRIVVRAGLAQTAAVAVLSVALALALPHSFFEDWGWFVGPAAWLACAAVVARVLGLPLASALTGAVLAGVPSAIAVVIGVHWLGAAVAIVVWALWCGRLAVDRGLTAEAV
jgi:hypothetical protein